jgi:hypothetical protein
MAEEVYRTILETLLSEASYAKYQAATHYTSHQRRGGCGGDCQAYWDHETAQQRAEDTLSAFLAVAERAA